MIREYIIVFVIMGIIDAIFLKFMVNYAWKDMIKDIQISVFNPNMKYLIIPYILMTLAIVIYVLPQIKRNSVLKDSILYGGLLGLIIYGVFDFTNLILFTRYKLSVGMGDMLWGGILFTIVTFLSKSSLLFLKDLI
mgnify:CR=1 FL=1